MPLIANLKQLLAKHNQQQQHTAQQQSRGHSPASSSNATAVSASHDISTTSAGDEQLVGRSRQSRDFATAAGAGAAGRSASPGASSATTRSAAEPHTDRTNAQGHPASDITSSSAPGGDGGASSRDPALNDNHPQQQQGQAQGRTQAEQQQLDQEQTQNTAQATTPGGTTMSAQQIPQNTKEHAEALVRRENEMRQRREAATYEGLPENIVLGRKMGDGAFSIVHEATLRPTAQQLRDNPAAKPVTVAVKCVRKYELNHSQGLAGKVPEGGEAPKKKKQKGVDRANILKEVQIMRGLNHPSIVRLYNFTESRDFYYLTLEAMRGGELFHQIVKLTYFSEELSRHVILQVASGIQYMHEERGVVHRDIKPENILFEGIPIIPSRVPKQRPYDEEKEDEGEFIPGVGGGGIGRVKIADFGLSKVVWDQDTMTPCGTVGYTAPEIVKDERYSKAVDMWALGCVLYTLLCGFPPFYDESINVLTEKVARGYYTFLSPWWDDISASSKDLITHLLDVNPETRYTIDEFLAHPWCKTKAPQPNITPGSLEQVAPGLKPVPKASGARPMDSPLLSVPGQRRGMPSPGVAQLKEAFDVTYAVHRMEEEQKRQRAGRAGGQTHQFMQAMNEEVEDEGDPELNKRKYGEEVSRAIEEKRRQVAASQPQQQTKAQQQRANQQYQGWGGADRKLAEAALYDGRAGTRDRGTRRNGGGNGFELSLNNSTLLGRRNKPTPAAGMKLAPEVTVDAPGSPMRLD